MTEEEARKKWCPFTRSITTTVDDIPSTNGSLKFECIASACMAWRWKPKVRVAIDGEVVGYDPDDTNGYCGLAGSP